MSYKLLFRRTFEFPTRQPQEIPLWLTAGSIVIEVRGEAQNVSLIQSQFFHSLGWVSVATQTVRSGLTRIRLDNPQPYTLEVVPVGKANSFEILLWIDRTEMAGNWREVTALEISSSWQWTAPILGSWFQLEISPSIATSIEVGQGDGSTIIGEVTTVESFSQMVYFSPPTDVLMVNDRRLTFRTAESVSVQEGWKVRVLVPVAEIGQPIERQILALLQQMQGTSIDGGISAIISNLQTQQDAILQILQQPIQAQIDPSLAANVETLLVSQAEILALVQEPSPSDPAIVASLQTLLTGQNQILQQFPVTVQPDPAVSGGIQQILSLLPSLVSLLYFGFGDRGGIFYFLGSNRLQQDWINPSINGVVVPQVSSLFQGTLLMPTDRASGVLWYTNNATNQWLSFDFKDYRVKPNFYTIQHTGETGYYVRNWKLQGSLDNATWIDLDTRTANTTINAVNGWGGFSVPGSPSAYRYLRVLMTGPDANGSDYLLIGEIEFYGQLSRG